MSATILDGKILAMAIKEQVSSEVAGLCAQTKKIPCVANLVIGKDPAAIAYADSQKKMAEDVGIRYECLMMDEDAVLGEVLAQIDTFNKSPEVSGIMIHKPLPAHLDEKEVFSLIDPCKDVEGLNATNMGNLSAGAQAVVPATAAAVMELVSASGISLRGKDVVIIGESQIVGRPLAMLFLNALATVTVCHIGTSEAGRLKDHTQRADVLVVAVGKPDIVDGSVVKDGALVIDVGINHVNGAIVGDVDFESVKQKAGMITPVPGGVGPLTAVMMMKNILKCFQQLHGIAS